MNKKKQANPLPKPQKKTVAVFETSNGERHESEEMANRVQARLNIAAILEDDGYSVEDAYQFANFVSCRPAVAQRLIESLTLIGFKTEEEL